MKNIFTIICAIMLCTFTLELNAQTQWTKNPLNPVFTGVITGWNKHVADSHVLYNPDSARYEMWYLGQTSAEVYNIGFAVSDDGVNWSSSNVAPVLSGIAGTWEANVYGPMVIREGGGYKMWYTGAPATFDSCCIGYATSPDGKNWTRYAGNPIMRRGTTSWEAGGVGRPSIIHDNGSYKMWYEGVPSGWTTCRIGRAVSADGITWERDTTHNPVINLGGTGEWDEYYISIPRVVEMNHILFMYYTGIPVGYEIRRIGLAISTDGGVLWTKFSGNPILNPGPAGSWDARSVQVGGVMLRDDTLHMWYAGRKAYVSAEQWRIGNATSLDKLLRVPQIYPTIQTAIDASINGDTVLVSDGTYNENISFKGKRIIVASNYLNTRNTSHILNTIIDGSNPSNPDSGSVVSFLNGEDTTSILCGFTIRGGTGTKHYIFSDWWRFGGGIFLNNSGGKIIDNIITRNGLYANGVAGGGIMALSSLMSLPNVILERNQIIENSAHEINAGGSGGGGACLAGVSCRVVGNLFERDSLVALGANSGGLVIQSYPPGPPYPLPSALVQGNIFRSNVARASTYCATGAGMLVMHTADVTISENIFEDNIGTSISGWAQGGGLCVTDQDITGYGRKLVLKNRFLNNHLSHGGSTLECGAGVFLYKTLATLDGNEITNNSADGTGGGIGAYRSSFRIQNNIITGNSTTTSGGGLDISYTPQVGTEQVVINNTIVDNSAGYNAGGMLVRYSANVVSLNNIFWSDTAQFNQEIYVLYASADIHHCNIEGGWVSGTGNINTGPRFILPRVDSLSKYSPCIGAGRDTMTIGGVLYSAPITDYHGHERSQPAASLPDIGAEESFLGAPMGETKITNKVLPGWNMISLPLSVSDQRKDSQYPTAISNAFAYNGSYIIADTLEFCVGYWLKFDSTESIEITGYIFEEDSIDVSDKWNMIGCTSEYIPVDSISSVPIGLIISNFFKFEGSTYQKVDTLEPGNGYWVKANQAGKLILSATGKTNASNRIKIVASNEQPPPPPSSEIPNPKSEIPKQFSLGQNYPNPFNPRTDIRFTISAEKADRQDARFTSLKVYDVLGREVATLVNEVTQPGEYTATWNAANVPSGIYFYRLTAGRFIETKKLILMK
jgi:predicted GH43/DUF377 family glycosyl hydrolase